MASFALDLDLSEYRGPLDAQAVRAVFSSSLEAYLGEAPSDEWGFWSDFEGPVWSVSVWAGRWADSHLQNEDSQAEVQQVAPRDLRVVLGRGVGQGELAAVLAHEVAHVAQHVEGSMPALLAASAGRAWEAQPLEQDAVQRSAEWVLSVDPESLGLSRRVWRHAEARAEWELQQME